jgi:hypothetical protein
MANVQKTVDMVGSIPTLYQSVNSLQIIETKYRVQLVLVLLIQHKLCFIRGLITVVWVTLFHEIPTT